MLLEKEMLGLYVSGHPLDNYVPHIERYSTIRSNELAYEDMDEVEKAEFEKYDGKEIKVLGIISSVRTKITKSNEIIAFITVEDLAGSINMIVFPRTFAQYRPLIEEDKIVKIEGRISIKEDVSIILGKIFEFEVRNHELYLALNDSSKKVQLIIPQDKTADELVNDMCDKICNILGDSVYTTDNIDLENYVLDLLKKKGYKFACAESCTGGLLADRITAVPGASQVFYGGYITYTNESKIRQLDVLPDTIDKYTAVSRQTALEMVKGVCNKTNAHVGVSITGYAGPADEKGLDPVGKVFIGLITPEGESVYEFNFTGNRDRIRMLCVVNALELVRRALMGIRGNE